MIVKIIGCDSKQKEQVKCVVQWLRSNSATFDCYI